MTADKTCAQPLTCGWLQSCKYDGRKVTFLQKTQIRGAFIIFHKRACQAKYEPGWGRGSSWPGSLCSESRRSDPGFQRRPGSRRGSPARPWQVGGLWLTLGDQEADSYFSLNFSFPSARFLLNSSLIDSGTSSPIWKKRIKVMNAAARE